MLHCLATVALSLTPVALPAGMDEEASELEKICEAARVAVEKAVEAEQSDSEEDGEASDYSDEGEPWRYCYAVQCRVCWQCCAAWGLG